ncbi:MAG: hypothetical protein JWQ30_239, partial [Sediminibacterium sp.]|nr:hypothetical protein [Sediminibacterium sp.]
LHGQSTDSLFARLRNKLHLKDSVNTTDLFLHLDRSAYKTGDEIWFTAYLLHPGSEQPSYHTLHVLLVDEMTRKIIRTESYVMESGKSSGKIIIPDSLFSGEYGIVAYTNLFLENANQKYFHQSVVLAGRRPPFTMQMTPVQKNDNSWVNCHIRTEDGEASNAQMIYALFADGTQQQTGSLTADQFGDVQIRMPVDYRLHQTEISGIITKLKKTMAFKMPVHFQNEVPAIRVFTQNGKLTNGIQMPVAFELTNANGKPIAARAALFENEIKILSFTSDVHGRGLFTFEPHAGKQYLIKVDGLPVPIQRLPEIDTNGYYLTIDKLLVEDTLSVTINTPPKGRKCILVIHNNQEMLFGVYVALTSNSGTIKIPVQEWTKGIATVSLFDENGNVLKRQSIFVKRDDGIAVTMELDSSEYHSRSKVNVRVRIKNAQGRPVKSSFSFSCALNQFVNERFTDIERFQNFDRFLTKSSSLLPGQELTANMANIVHTLFQVGAVAAGNTWGPDTSLPFRPFDGHVLYQGKLIKKPVGIVILGAQPVTIMSDNAGRFVIPYLYKRGEITRKVIVGVKNTADMGYKLNIDTPWAAMDGWLANKYYPMNAVSIDEFTLEEKDKFHDLAGVELDEVVVSAKKRYSPENYIGVMNSNGLCDDYVCAKGILNCKLHDEPLSRPYEGEKFGNIIYHCIYKNLPPYMGTVNSVWYAEEYPYLISFKKASEKQLVNTTLHWIPEIFTDENGEASFSFYTNDVRGKFNCILQGVSDMGAFSGNIKFMVSDNKN